MRTNEEEEHERNEIEREMNEIHKKNEHNWKIGVNLFLSLPFVRWARLQLCSAFNNMKYIFDLLCKITQSQTGNFSQYGLVFSVHIFGAECAPIVFAVFYSTSICSNQRPHTT